MKRFLQSVLDLIFPWKKRMAVLEERLSTLTIQNGVLAGLLDEERKQRDKVQLEHERSKQGLGVLLKFIHASHHLDVPLAEGTIREAIQKGMNENAR